MKLTFANFVNLVKNFIRCINKSTCYRKKIVQKFTLLAWKCHSPFGNRPEFCAISKSHRQEYRSSSSLRRTIRTNGPAMGIGNPSIWSQTIGLCWRERRPVQKGGKKQVKIKSPQNLNFLLTKQIAGVDTTQQNFHHANG